MMNNTNPGDHAPQGGEWHEFPAGAVGTNNTFGGHEGNFTTEPDMLVTSKTKFYVVGDRVTHIWIDGYGDFRHENTNGSNIHGGNHTTAEWFTIDVGQFRLVAPDGRIYHDSPRLTDKPEFRGVHTLTPRTPLPAPCFGAQTQILVRITRGDYVNVRHMAVFDLAELMRDNPNPKMGYEVRVAGGWAWVIWCDGGTVSVSDNNRPVEVWGSIFSPLHRILVTHDGRKSWAKAKFVGKEIKSPYDMIWYGHILLTHHAEIMVFGGYVESLLPTDRALSAMSQQMAADVRSAIDSFGESYGLKPEYQLSHRDLTRGEASSVVI